MQRALSPSGAPGAGLGALVGACCQRCTTCPASTARLPRQVPGVRVSSRRAATHAWMSKALPAALAGGVWSALSAASWRMARSDGNPTCGAVLANHAAAHAATWRHRAGRQPGANAGAACGQPALNGTAQHSVLRSSNRCRAPGWCTEQAHPVHCMGARLLPFLCPPSSCGIHSLLPPHPCCCPHSWSPL
jgi:hypothetical protein